MEITAAGRVNQYTDVRSLAQRVTAHLEATRSSIAAVAKDVNYSRTTVSRYLSGKYDGDATALESKLAAWLAEQTGEAVEPPAAPQPGKKGGTKPAFFESKDAVNILGVCQSCQEYIGLGIVVARSGYGKTHTLRHYAKLPRVAYIECDDTMSSRDLIEAIERSLGHHLAASQRHPGLLQHEQGLSPDHRRGGQASEQVHPEEDGDPPGDL